MKRKKWIIVIFSLLSIIFFIGCTKQEPTYEPNEKGTTQYTPLTNKGIVQQQPADDAKKMLSGYEEVSRVHAVHHDEALMIAIEIEHDDRFSLDHLEKKFSEKLQEKFPHLKIDVSTDQKLLFELDELENQLASESISEKKIEKKINKLRKLMKEKT